MLPRLELAAAIAELLLCGEGSALDVALLLPPHATATRAAIASSAPTLPESLQLHRRVDGCRCDCIVVASRPARDAGRSPSVEHVEREVVGGAVRVARVEVHRASRLAVGARAAGDRECAVAGVEEGALDGDLAVLQRGRPRAFPRNAGHGAH